MIRALRSRPDSTMLVLGWLMPIIPELDALWLRALPHAAIVFDTDAPLTVGRSQIGAMVALAKLPAPVPIHLVGYSAGCQSVRSALQQQAVQPYGVACFDGTHDDVRVNPETGKRGRPWVTSLWAKRLSDAAQGIGSTILTATSMGYTEHIPPGQKGAAKSTRHVIEDAMDEAFPEGAPHDLPADEILIRGNAYVLRSESADVDTEAHKRQLWAGVGIVAAMWGGHPEELQPSPPPVIPDVVQPLATRLLAWAEEEAKNPEAIEDPAGSNTSARIREYFGLPYERRATGDALRLTSGAWCAAAACFGLAEVAEPGEKVPPPRVAGIELQEDAQAILKAWEDADQDDDWAAAPPGCWVPVSAVMTQPDIVKPGWLCICKRAGESWFRHVTIVAELDHVRRDRVRTLAGNESNKWGSTWRSTKTGEILGFIKV